MADRYNQAMTFRFLNRREKLLRKLNDTKAPMPISTMLNVINTVGRSKVHEADQVAKTAIDSDDINVMNQAIEKLETISQTTPEIHKGYISSVKDSISIAKGNRQKNIDFAKKTDEIMEQFNKQPQFARTEEALDVIRDMRMNVWKAGKHVEEGEKTRRKNVIVDQQNKLGTLEILSRFDADPSTPDVIDIDPKSSYIEQQYAQRAGEILRAYAKTGDWETGLSKADELSRTTIRTDIAVDRESDRIARQADRALSDQAEKYEEELSKSRGDVMDVLMESLTDEVENATRNNPDASPEEIYEIAWGKLSESTAIKSGSVTMEDARIAASGIDPESPLAGQLRKTDFKGDNLIVSQTHLDTKRTIEQEELDNRRQQTVNKMSTIMTQVSQIMESDSFNKSLSKREMSKLSHFTTSLAKDNLENIDIEGAIKDIDRTLMELFKENDSWNFWGFADPGIQSTYGLPDDFDIEKSPFDSKRKKSMDALIHRNNSKKNHFNDDDQRDVFMQLRNLRNLLYNSKDEGLFSIDSAMEASDDFSKEDEPEF